MTVKFPRRDLSKSHGGTPAEAQTRSPMSAEPSLSQKTANDGKSPPVSKSPNEPAKGQPEKQLQPEPLIEIEGFNAYYGDFQAIHSLSLEIPSHQVTAFIGPSGCGKSTLLRWINRMNDIVPSARATGTLRMGPLDILSPSTDAVALRRKIGIVFQKPNPFPKSIYDNVAFGPRLHMKTSKSELDELVEWALRKAAVWEEVKDRLQAPALGLSGGQQQRLCIARAIAVGPEVLLMDEPCSALDPASTLAIEELMDELRDQYTMVIVTHNMQQASRCSDKTAFFFEGKLIETNDTELIFTKPKSKQTEDYVRGRFG